MIRIVHLSDFHFGADRPELVEPLLAVVDRLSPRVVVVSGDLTQRARPAQYAAAADLLGRMAGPVVTVPGNHDVPLWNVYLRMVRPLKRYRRYIARDVEPTYGDADLLVVALNTARSFTGQHGWMKRRQIRQLECRLNGAPAGAFKVVVMHHPFVLPEHIRDVRVVGRARQTLDVLERCGTDLILASHVHHQYACHTGDHYDGVGRSILVAQTGTALSYRLREQPNSFDAIDIHSDAVEICTHVWDEAAKAFQAAPPRRFERQAASLQSA